MLTLCIDTAYRYLTCVLIKDDEILASYSEECFKRQSEMVFGALEKIFKEAGVSKTDIDSICISEGPGSYTGVRIAMTIAKTIGQIASKKVYKISTLRLYASMNKKTMVIMDARANRAYVGIYDKDRIMLDDCIIEIDKINPEDYDVVLDGQLIGKAQNDIDIPLAFLKTKGIWEEVENINHLSPKYLKESDAYYR